MLSQTFIEKNIPEIARKIVSNITGSDILAFSGNLATGKTALAKEIVKQMGFKGAVQSPTFILERHYSVDFQGIKEIIHLDFYRLNDEGIKTFDWQEYINDPEKVLIIEWPEVISQYLPPNAKKFTLEIMDEKTRKITFPEHFND